jgi:hypothetical protein
MNKHTKFIRAAIILSSLTLLLASLGWSGLRGVVVEDVVPGPRGTDVYGLIAGDIPPGPRGVGEPDSGGGIG